MPTTVQDVIQTALRVQDLLLARRSQDEVERAGLVQRIATAQGLATTVDRETQPIIAQQFEEQGLVGDTDLDPLLAGGALDPRAETSRSAERGLAALPEEDLLQADREAALQQLTGGGSLELGLAGAADQLNPEQLLRSVEAGVGVGLTAAQSVDAEIRNRGLELNYLDLTQRGALGEAELATRLAIADMDARLGLARIMAEEQGDINAAAELSTFASLARNLEANKTGMSNTDIIAHLTAMKTIFTRLNAAGYPVPPDLFDQDIDDITGGDTGGYLGVMGGMARWFRRGIQGREREAGR